MKNVAPLLAAALDTGRELSTPALEAAFACRTVRKFPVLELYCRPDLPASMASQLWDQFGAAAAAKPREKAGMSWRAAHLLRPEHHPADADAHVWTSLKAPDALTIAALIAARKQPGLAVVADHLTRHANVHVRASAARNASADALDIVLDDLDQQVRDAVGDDVRVDPSCALGRALTVLGGTGSATVRLRAAQRWTTHGALAAVAFTGLPADVVDDLVVRALLPELPVRALSVPRAKELATRFLYALKIGVQQQTAVRLRDAWAAEPAIPARMYGDLSSAEVHEALSVYGLSTRFGARSALGRLATTVGWLGPSDAAELLERMETLEASTQAWTTLAASLDTVTGELTWGDLMDAAVAATTT